jgi:hypothetical protein
MNYGKARELISNNSFKDIYKKNCNRIMELNGKIHNQWKLHNINGFYGLMDNFGGWCWRNTINTHPNCFVYLYNTYIELGGEPIEFDEYDEQVKKFWDFLGSNWELIFTKNITTKYFQKLKLLTNKSWSIGQITTISFLYEFRNFFPNMDFKKIKFSLERGDPKDFLGIDIELYTLDEQYLSVQVKEGNFDDRGSFYRVTSSVNDLRSKSKFYCFVDMDKMEIVLFKNDNKFIEKYSKQNLFLFPKEIFVNHIKFNLMNVSKKLHDILLFCAQNNIVFDLVKIENQENSVVYTLGDEKNVTININNFKDENLYNLLDDKHKELQQLLN